MTNACTPLPPEILEFLRAQHVLSLATVWQGEPWAASCFYALDEADAALLILSDEQTLHAQAMRAHPQVAGTVAGQPEAIRDIRGVQFRAHASLLAGDAAECAFATYCERHPVARLHRSAVWRLRLLQIKHTDNALVFARKTLWQREA